MEHEYEMTANTRSVSAGPPPTKPDYFPDFIEAQLTRYGNWVWIDTRTGKRTYESWIADRYVREIELAEEGLSAEYPSTQNRNLVSDLRMHFGTNRTGNAKAVAKLADIRGCLKKDARVILVEMWQQGLLRRYGKYDARSNRLCKQEWEVETVSE